MATPAQIIANRLNALKSTGPRSAEGKAASRFNALKHAASAKKHDSGFRRFRSFLRRNSQDQFNAAEAQLAVDYRDEFIIYETDPFTGKQFKVPDLNNTELGLLIG